MVQSRLVFGYTKAHHLFANSPATDAASDAPMAVVMLPDLTVADTSGGALGVNVPDQRRA